MTPDSDDRDRLSGLARSIDRLFSDAESQEEKPASDTERPEAGVSAVEPDETPTPDQVDDTGGSTDEPAVDAFWEMDEVSPGTGLAVDESHEAEPDVQEFDAADLDPPELDDAEVAASGLGGDDFELSELERVDYDDADFDSDVDDEAWAELLAEAPETADRDDASADFPERDGAPAEDPEWDTMDRWDLDLVGDGRPEEQGATGDVDEAGTGTPVDDPVTKEDRKPEAAPPAPAAPDEAAGPGTLFERAVETCLEGSENPTRARTRIQHYAEALAEEGDVEVVADGVERLADAGGDALEVAREILSPPVAYALASRLSRFSGEEERRERIELAVRLGYDFAAALSKVLAETENKVARYALVDALVAMGVDGWDAVVEMVGDERWWVVRNAVLVLGRTGGEESVRFLARTIEHDDPRVRLETVRALEEIGGVKARERIQSRLDDEAPRVRAAAVRAVGTLQIEGARERLRMMLEQESDEIVVVAVIETLGQMGDEASIARFEKKLEGSFFRKPTTEIRAAVYGAFGAIGTPRALELLHAASDEKDPVTRTLARRVLRDREDGEADEGAR